MSDGIRSNLLYFGDNLEWLRDPGRFPDESVDLVYLDPPFNSNRNYNVLFKEQDVRESEAQIHAFEDTWSWDREGRVQAVFDDFWVTAPEKPKQMLKALIDALGHNDVTAYLTMMAPRLVELHRVLKPTGSLYLHCDPTASHYLKIMLDSIFGPQNFLNEIVWQRFGSHNDARRFGRVSDSILLYSRSSKYTFNPVFGEYSDDHIEKRFRYSDPDGRKFWPNTMLAPGGRGPRYEWNGHTRNWRFTEENMRRLESAGEIYYSAKGMPYRKNYLDELEGQRIQNVWSDIKMTKSGSERLGYPTQKPLALLERIISASSNEGDVVLDPFCGCGTAVHAAYKLNRKWIGIDITPLATNLIRERMQDAFPGLVVPIEGWPADYAGARALAADTDKYHFQDWAVIQAGGRPASGSGPSKKGADRGIDGVIPFIDGSAGGKRGVISVKAGKTGPTHIRDLAGVVAGDTGTEFGVFLCLDEPTKAMNEAALEQGTWTSEFDGQSYPRIQILSAQDLIDGKPVRMPSGARASRFAKAPREKRAEGQQGRLGE